MNDIFDFEELKIAIFNAKDDFKQQGRIVTLIDEYILNYGLDTFVLNYAECRIENYQQEWTLLAYCCYWSMLDIARKLTESKIDINQGVSIRSPKNYHIRTPLQLACFKNNIEIVKLLLEKKALLECNVPGILLDITTSIEIMKLLLESSTTEDIIDYLLPGSDHTQKIHAAQRYFWNYPELAHYFDKIVKELMKSEKTPEAINYHATYYCSREIFYGALFKGEYPIGTVHSREDALKKAIAQLCALFYDLEECNKYFKLINQELERYCQETYQIPFPTINPESYEYHKIYQYYFPVPNETYERKKPTKLLREYLLLFLQNNGLAREQYKLIGFVEKRVADKYFSQASFLIENNDGVVNFHGRDIHMIQHALLAIAIYNKKVETVYQEASKTHHICAADIIHYIVTNNLWSRTHDDGPHFLSFSDPAGLNSYLMYKRNEFKSLADCLIGSFCNGILKSYESHFQLKLREHYPISFKEYIFKYADQKLHTAILPTFILKNSIWKQEQKKRIICNTDHADYAVVERPYFPNREFKTKITI